MKRFLLAVLILFTGITLCSFIGVRTAKANAEELETQMFLPSSYFEYFDLNSPVDVCEDENFVYIAETEGIVLFDKSTQTYSRVSLEGKNVTKIDCYNGYVLFLDSSRIYYFRPQDENYSVLKYTEDEEEVLEIPAEYFVVDGNYLYVCDTSKISRYTLSGGEISALSRDTHDKITNATVIVAGGDDAYYFEGIYLKRLSDRTTLTQENTATVYRFAKYYGGKIYYSTSEGIKAYDLATTQKVSVTDFNANNGFSIIDDRMLLADKENNLLKEIDLSDFSYTEKCVTTYSELKHRLTDKVVTSYLDNDLIYVLQKDYLSVFALDGSLKCIVDIDLSFMPTMLAVSENHVLLANGTNTLKIYKKTLGENSVACTEIFSCQGEDVNNVIGIVAFEGNFYLVKNKTVAQSNQYATVFKIALSGDTATFNTDTFYYFDGGRGTATDCTVNPFGQLFIRLENSAIITYDIINKRWEQTSYTLPACICMQADFEHLYALTEDGVLNANTGVNYTFVKNGLDDGAPLCLNLCLSQAKAYLIYNGYILSSALPMKAGEDFSVPLGYNMSFKDEIFVGNLILGAKMYKVEQKGEMFCVTSSDVCKHADRQYILISQLSSDFVLVTYQTDLYIVRSLDYFYEQAQIIQPDLKEGYYLTKTSVYCIPALNPTFETGKIQAYSKAEIIGMLEINGVTYYKIELENGQQTYIVNTFIAENISEDAYKENINYVYLSKAVVYDENGQKIGVIKGEKVVVYGLENGKYKIKYEDGFGYIKATALPEYKSHSVRNAMLIVLVATAMCITAIYLQIRYNRKQSVSD